MNWSTETDDLPKYLKFHNFSYPDRSEYFDTLASETFIYISTDMFLISTRFTKTSGISVDYWCLRESSSSVVLYV